MSEALQYVKDQGGIDTEASYNYRMEDPTCDGKNHTNCRCYFDKSHVGATIKGYVNVTGCSEDKLDLAIASVGPISVAVYADFGFQFYESGKESFCFFCSLITFFKTVKYTTYTPT